MEKKVFISYSWDNEDHKEWVKCFADSLLSEGIEAVIDQYDVSPGERLPKFMERAIASCDYVLIICTPHYKKKADDRNGGVGYESNIITGDLHSKHNDLKYIPIIREGDFETAMPTYMAGKLAINLKENNSRYDIEFKDLLTTIRGENKKPPVIRNNKSNETPNEGQEKIRSLPEEEPLYITGIVTDEVTIPRNDGTRGSALYMIPFRLSREPSFLWKELFIQHWNHPLSFSTMHRPGIATIVGDKIILDGTTIEEVKEYHRDTLVACVNRTNQKEQQLMEEQKRREDSKRKAEEEHSKNVLEVSSQIKF